MEELIAYRHELLSALGREVEELATLVSTLAADNGYRPSASIESAAHYALFHLRALETQEFALQLRRILEEEVPRLDSFDDAAWMASQYTVEEPIQAIIQDMVRMLSAEIEMLEGLPALSWSRFARHPRWGVHTLLWWVELQQEVTSQHLLELHRLLAA
jgi:hypothetical protein